MRIYEICCTSSGDDHDVDHILGGLVSDKLVAMTESTQLTTRLLAEPVGRCTGSKMSDAGSTADLPPREGRTGELRRGGPCRGPCLPLTDALPFPHPCITGHVKNAGILFTPAKIYSREN